MGPSAPALDAERFRRLAEATAHLEPPFAVLDGAALQANADDLVRRAAGRPIRIASKSVRVRSVVEDLLRRPGFAGVLAYSLAEALWLAGEGTDDVVVGYPTTDREALRRLGADPSAQRAVALMIDDVAQLDLVEAVVPADAVIRCVLDVDASLRVGRLHLGARRSPVHTAEEAAGLAREVVARPWARLAGVMMYDAQVAGQQDDAVLRRVKRASLKDLAVRRAAVVDAVRAVAPDADLLVNAGGTGSLHLFGDDTAVTELAAGSGLFAPSLFDGYDDFDPTPAAFFVTTVVRRPAPGWATAFAGGYVASGAAGRSRLPRPVWPRGLRLTRLEAAGEVQTPLVGPGARDLRIGDRVWFRHAKAGELCERFASLHVVGADGSVDVRPTYRGEGRCFG